jgi:uncharacterized repeat protein (TIGR01451 family)
VPLAALAFAGGGAAAPVASTDLKITIADSPDPVAVGSTLGYEIEVVNAGPATATGVTVTVALPKGVDFVSAASSGQCKRQAQKVSCDLGTVGVPAGMYATSAAVLLAAIPRQPGTITTTATVKGAQKDPDKANDKATATTKVLGAAANCRGVPATIVGTSGDDVLTGTGGRDVIAGFGGADTISSLAGRDLVCAGAGNDQVGAGSAADRVFGGAGGDRLLGRGGPDVLHGNAGNDALEGNRGADRLRGGSGRDRCRGGAGADSIRGCEL